MEDDSQNEMNQTRPLPEDAHQSMSTTEFYEEIGEELEQALSFN